MSSFLNSEAAKIRRPASSTEFMQPLVNRVNWLHAAQKGLIFHGAWINETALGVSADLDSRIYHRQSLNCDRIGVLAIVENAEESTGGYLNIQASAGSTGEEIDFYTDQDSSASMAQDANLWQIWFKTAETAGTGVQYHTIQTTNLNLRYLALFEMPRELLDPATENVVKEINGSYSGILNGRMICDDATSNGAGLLSLYTLIASAEAATDRQGGGFIIPPAKPWYTASTSLANLADGKLGTSDFTFKHRAREVRNGTTEVTYQVYFHIALERDEGDTATYRFESSGTSDYAEVTTSSNSWNWQTDEVTVDVTANDDLKLRGMTDDATNKANLISCQWFE